MLAAPLRNCYKVFSEKVVNNIGQSMWSAVKVFLNEVSVQSSFHHSQISNVIQILTTSNLAVDGVAVKLVLHPSSAPYVVKAGAGNHEYYGSH